MALRMIWDDRYLTGVDRLDREHQALFEYYNRLIEACATSSEEAAAGVALLERYAETHFEHEEAVMVDSRYPYYLHHKMDHESFLVELHRLKSALSAGENVLDDLCRFLKNWLASHIAIRDAAIANHLHDLSVAAD
jgi:hemerythrin-like metal-binding protein